MSLVHCIYSSHSTKPDLSTDELDAILEQSRRNNEKVDVTGILLHYAGTFFQVLEGEEDVVEKLYARIAQDPRHERVAKIVQEPIEERAFGDWTMGYPKITRKDLEQIPGLNDFFNHGNSFQEMEEGRAKTLLAAFKEGKWRRTLS